MPSPTAARRAAGAGFDVLELDMGHGYLLASFLSPESNRREDEYGGDLGGRLRFPLQVLDAVREAWPEDQLLAVRLNVMDGTRHGLKLPDGIAIARELAAHGCGLVHVVAGQTVPEAPRPTTGAASSLRWPTACARRPACRRSSAAT